MSRNVQITFDCHDPRALSVFWREALGYVIPGPPGVDVPGLTGDERMAALERESDRLVDLGARRLERHEPAPPMAAGHLVMADPEGNEFCLD
ncbi:hypothetical protein GOARA_061_00070 [Gordonia araii NBRC 100433]|uniref:Glyoxalase-like domain-containing protein n=1 Tax=Gordonia araii NBRC 100433 TaxID=1073574 RepID=G7H3Z3_9ACTN|nr:VOC family protein [Gordonia araii]NNG96367.1 VOC family protein [Gordonia araii NBRC 100433]GAB10568.1 hypothetical protein GOARA_061_00070 [Gordonia araii NBRC 100433]